jgi:hypothetical protein
MKLVWKAFVKEFPGLIRNEEFCFFRDKPRRREARSRILIKSIPGSFLNNNGGTLNLFLGVL